MTTAQKTDPVITKTATQNSLAALLEQAKNVYENPRIINTEQGRTQQVQIIRLLETLIHGEPKTLVPSRNHP